MKTHTIKTPTAELMIVELPKVCDYHFTPAKFSVYDHETKKTKIVNGPFEWLGKPDEISEDHAKELVNQSIHTGLFAHYVKDIPVNTYCYKNATESILSAINTEISWENLFGEYPNINDYIFEDHPELVGNPKEYNHEEFEEDVIQWNEAQSRTFDRNRTLIFVKN